MRTLIGEILVQKPQTLAAIYKKEFAGLVFARGDHLVLIAANG